MPENKSLYKVIHLIPYDTIGGVESAAQTMGSFHDKNIDFTLKYIYKELPRSQGMSAFYDIWLLFTTAWHVQSLRPHLLIVSLWRSSIVGVLVKIFSPTTKLVTFLHSEHDFHFLDYLSIRSSVRLSIKIWGDSEATFKGRLSKTQRQLGRVISFVTKSIKELPQKKVEPVFIFWGRLHSLKGLDRAIRIFAEIHKKYTTSRFVIVGPDAGVLSDINKLCVSHDFADSVIFKGPATFNEIVSYARLASFYLQTSLIEGMAMSVIEAMQLGLVPVVTPVGEVGSYCYHEKNAVIIGTDEQVVEDVLSLLASNERYQALREEAIATWQGKPLYRESVLHACHEILDADLSRKKGRP